MDEESQSVLDQIYDYYQDDFKNTLTLENILHESDDDTNLSTSFIKNHNFNLNLIYIHSYNILLFLIKILFAQS
jgi:S-adenosylmethionine/arginine decarboxylase-like enzyme